MSKDGSGSTGLDKTAWNNIVNAGNGKDLSGGANYMCTGSQNCVIVHQCKNTKGVMVPRIKTLDPSGTVTLNGYTTYFYNDPLLGNCPASQ
jgi:hypothetical protein